VWTAPNHPLGDYPALKWQRFAPKVAGLVARRSVLDIGCNGGFYSIEMKRLGASRVVGIDSDPGYLDQARFAARMTGADIDFLQLSVYDVASIGERFDIVLFMGVLYHLRHPLLALDLISEHVAADRLIFQSMLRGSADVESVADDYPIKARRHFDRPGYPRLHFVEHRYARDPTNWWVPNRACCEAMLRSSGFSIEEQVEEEVFVCRRVRRPEGEGAVYPARREP
jgi:tRNA (mo5U34)-methyltransferase